MADVRPPKSHEPGCCVERMPLVEAAVMAMQPSKRFNLDINVVDLHTPE